MNRLRAIVPSDAMLAGVTILLTAVGLVTVYSASAYNDAIVVGRASATAMKQGLGAVAGLLLMFVLSRQPYRRLYTWKTRIRGVDLPGAYVLWGASLLSMFLVWVPGLGHKANGASRWIDVGPVNLQPSEFLKLTTILALARFLHDFRDRIREQMVLGVVVMGCVPLIGLVGAQKDLGSLAIMLGSVGCMLFLAGLPIRYFTGLLGAGVLVVAAFILSSEFRRQRVLNYLDPFADCGGTGYQVCQSLVAFHNGGVTGQGMGQGLSQLNFLPEAHNDFIAAVFGEAWGLAGMLVLFALFTLFTWRGLEIARGARTMHGFLLAGTITLLIAGQAGLNVGVALGLVPNKGLVLPFMSYGGSAMIVNLAAVGILLAIHADVPRTAPATMTATAEAPAAQPTSTGA